MRVEYDGGVWWAENGELHLDIPKLLARVSLEDTAENRDLAVEEATKAVGIYLPGMPCVIR